MAIGNLPAYNAEYTPPTLRAVGQAVVDHFPEITWNHIGFKGNDLHDSGYHRSIRWNYLTRGYGANYSDKISRDTSQRTTVRKDAIRAIDITAPLSVLLPMCQRLDQAVRAGRLEVDVREWYGNDDGDNRVDGYDNFYNRVATSDPSHLWHLHISFYTDTVDQPHTTLISVLIGTDAGGNDIFMALTPAQEQEVLTGARAAARVNHLLETGERMGGAQTSGGGVIINWFARQIFEIDADNVTLRNQLTLAMNMIQQLITLVNTGGGNLDTAAILEKIERSGAAQLAELRARWEREEQAQRAAVAVLDTQPS